MTMVLESNCCGDRSLRISSQSIEFTRQVIFRVFALRKCGGLPMVPSGGGAAAVASGWMKTEVY